MDLGFYLFAVLTFGAVILLIEGAFLWWSGTRGAAAQRMERRLRFMSASPHGGGERVSILKQRRFSHWPPLDALLRRLAPARAIDALLLQAGVRWSAAQFLALSLGLLLAGALLVQAWPMPAPARLVLVALLTGAPLAMARSARTRRLRQLEVQLPEAADFIGRALRAGHSFTNVLHMVGTELGEPISGEFRIAHEEIHYGVPLNDALHNLAARIPLTDLRYMVIAVLVQRESGGNLAEILGNISRIIRARLQLIAQVRVLSAEGRMSAWVMGALPFAVTAVLALVNPRYIRVLWSDPVGVSLSWYAAAMILCGVVWMRGVIRLRV